MRHLKLILIGLALAAAAAVPFVLGRGTPPAPAQPVYEIDGAAQWVRGHRCPVDVAHDDCKLLFPLRAGGG